MREVVVTDCQTASLFSPPLTSSPSGRQHVSDGSVSPKGPGRKMYMMQKK